MASANDTYIATGGETSITRPALVNQVILMIIKGNAPLQYVSSGPNASQYTYNNTTGQITFGAALSANTVIQTIYRPI